MFEEEYEIDSFDEEEYENKKESRKESGCFITLLKVLIVSIIAGGLSLLLQLILFGRISEVEPWIR